MKPIEAHSTAKIKAKVTREEQAVHELAHTEFAPGARTALVVFFLLAIVSVPLAQFLAAIRHPGPLAEARAGLRAMVPSREQVQRVDGVVRAVNLLPPAQQLKAFEENWEQNSVVGEQLLPPVQAALLRLGQGNEKAYLGRGGWLFYRSDVDYVTGPAFLDQRRLHARRIAPEAPQPDPRRAVLAFAAQLRERGIQLVLMPTPVKPMIEPEHFAPAFTGASPLLNNPSYGQFVDEMQAAGVRVYDCAEVLRRAKQVRGEAQYLETDTHWAPAAMEQAAAGLAAFLRTNLPAAHPAVAYQRETQVVTNLGDVALMVRLPPGQQRFRPQAAIIHPVVQPSGMPWRPDPAAAVLVLGDSFCNIFSMAAMGWGEDAGFVEQLSFDLQQPVDALLRNDAGAHATRAMLAQELARGHDRLEGKKVVVWQFAARELALGDWKPIELKLGKPAPSAFVTLKDGESITVCGRIGAVAAAPRPGTVPYKDHIVAIHLTDIRGKVPGSQGGEALVYAWSMRNGVWQTAARCTPGQTVEMRLSSWSTVAAKCEGINRAELSDPALLAQDPCWGEFAQEAKKK
jgi:alginate O-acetyltransferase complex protein AlgJ